MTDLLDRDAIDPPAVAVLALFEGPLGGVRFPEVDNEALQALASAVRSSAREVATARAALVVAQADLGAAERSLVADELALRERCVRAIAYARVYATTAEPSLRDSLAGVLSSIDLPSAMHSAGARAASRGLAAAPGVPPSGAAPRRRGRPRAASRGTAVSSAPSSAVESTLFTPQARPSGSANDVEIPVPEDAGATAAE